MSSLLWSVRAAFGSRLAFFERMAREFGDIGRVDLPGRSLVLVNAPELVEEVLIGRVDCFIKGPALRILSRPLLGDGLLTSEGDEHRRHRKLVAPAFAHQRVGRYAEVMRRRARETAAAWRDGETLDINAAMTRLTLGIVGETLFDTDLLDDPQRLARDITLMQRYVVRRSRFLSAPPLSWPTPGNLRVRAARDRLNATVYDMIRSRRESGRDHGDLLSMLLLSRDEIAGEALTDREVRDESMTLFLAGHETTAQGLSWAWYLLARHPDVATRVPRDPDYALRVFKETLRLYPPAYALGRTAASDVRIGGFPIRAGELLIILPWLLHRDERFFPNPLAFDPDRFLPERESAIPRFAYMPFGGGKRICIGNQFALMEGQILLHEIAQRVNMEPVGQPVREEALLTLRPRGGVMLKLRRKEKRPVASP